MAGRTLCVLHVLTHFVLTTNLQKVDIISKPILDMRKLRHTSFDVIAKIFKDMQKDNNLRIHPYVLKALKHAWELLNTKIMMVITLGAAKGRGL